MRTHSRTFLWLPLLTWRRHIDFGRASSAFCRPVRAVGRTRRHHVGIAIDLLLFSPSERWVLRGRGLLVTR
jgi:hypothetical protein